MTTWFVTRHPGAKVWAEEEGFISAETPCQIVESLNPAQDISAGDVVIGTLPIHLVAEIGERGGRYLHLALNVPPDFRGRELTADDMRKFGCTVRAFAAFGTENTVHTPAAASDKTLHICLVSEQYMANLLPVLKRHPARVELVCTIKMKTALIRLGNALEYFGYSTAQASVHSLPDDCATDFLAARHQARMLRQHLLSLYPDWHFVLNATGGTKALSMAFFMEFQGAEIIYTDSDGVGFIRHLSDVQHPPEPTGRLVPSITDFLYCQGYTEVARSGPDWTAEAERLQSVSNHLAQVMGNGSFVASQLNTWRTKVERQAFGSEKPAKFSPHQQESMVADVISQMHYHFKGKFAKTASFLADQGLLVALNDLPDCYLFSNRDAMDYLGGGWLEQWAWLQARACQPHEMAANLEVLAKSGSQSDPDQDKDNELDLVVLHNNRLLIAECKTIQWRGQSAKQEIFNKLDALGTHARGLFGKTLLITAYPLDERAMRRAKAYNIQPVLLTNLTDLKTIIKKWMNGLPTT